MQLEVLEVGVAARLRRDLGDVELVVDVAIQSEAFLLHRGDRLARERERDRDVEEEFAADRIGDGRALVADGRVVEAGLLEVGPDGSEHPAGHEDDVDPSLARRADGRTRARPKHPVLGDQRPIEIAGERRDLARELRREDQGLVRNATRSATCWSVSWPP